MDGRKKVAIPVTRGMTPENTLGEGIVRRLVQFQYQCRLCGGTHPVENYVSIIAGSIQEFREKVTQFYTLAEMPDNIFDGAAEERHDERGDLAGLLAQAKTNGLRRITRAPGIVITDESEYTCDDCGMTLPAINALRQHRNTCYAHAERQAGEGPGPQTGPLAKARLFAAQSVLCVDEPGGEFTSGTPEELFEWAVQEGGEIAWSPAQDGRDAAIRFPDGSTAFILARPDGRVIVGDNGTGNPAEHEDEWGIIGPDTPEGRRYLAELDRICRAGRTSGQEKI